MELALIIYLIDVLAVDEVGYGPGIFLGIMLLIVSGLIFGLWTEGWNRGENTTKSEKNGLRVWDSCKKTITWTAILLIASGVFTRIIPSQETAYKMLIAGAGYEMATSETANKYMKVAGKMIDESAKEFLGEDKWNELMADEPAEE